MVASCEIVLFVFFVKMFHFFDTANAKRSRYERLSLRLDKMLSEIESIRTKVEKNEDRIGDIENKLNLYADLSKHITTDDTAQDVDGTSLALALKTLSSEKRILREAVGKFGDQFGKFKSDIQKEMTEFKIFVKDQLENESTATKSVHNSVNKSIVAISNDMSEFKANLTSLSGMYDIVSEDLQSIGVSVIQNANDIVGFVNSLRTMTQNISALEANRISLTLMYDTVSQNLQSVNVSVLKNAKGIFDVVNSARALAQNISFLQANHDVTVKDTRQTLRSEVEGTQSHISEMTKVKPRTVSSFSATFAHRLSDGVLKYDLVHHKEGPEFNKETGTFTCRVPGQYLFVANVVEVGYDENYVGCALRKNTNAIVNIFSRNGKDSTGSYTKAGFGAATGAVTLHMSPGDSMYVWCLKETSEVWYSSFTGCLIAEDP